MALTSACSTNSKFVEGPIFLFSPIASKHSVFPLTKVSASEVPAILKKFVSEGASSEAAILKLSWQPDRVYVMSFGPTWNWWQGEKPTTELASFTKSAKSIFSKRLSTSLSSMLSFRSSEHVWLKLIWLKSSSGN